MWGIKLKRIVKSGYSDYKKLKRKLLLRFALAAVAANIVIISIYKFIWFERGSYLLISAIQYIFGLDYYGAVELYQLCFRNYFDVIWIGAVAIVFIVLIYVVLNWFAEYFNMINVGIDGLLDDKDEIRLNEELAATEQKLNEVKAELKRRAKEASISEQRKNELVMYLAHDIRTPLTSVIGYLDLLAEAPDMPAEQRAKYTGIAIEKAHRLEKMVNDFFEITRFNWQQINISSEPIDLYYMIMQVSDELSPLLLRNGNSVKLDIDEDFTIEGDPDQLARVFNNLLKNAASYSFPNTEVTILAEKTEAQIAIVFKNIGRPIPKEKLQAIFDKFYRLDDSRATNHGGTGLGLAIAKEIVTLHGGSIVAESKGKETVFIVNLPISS